MQGNGVTIGSDSERQRSRRRPRTSWSTSRSSRMSRWTRADLSGVDLRVHVHGPYAFSGFIANSGKSFTTLPSYSASVTKSVQISVDNPAFANPIPGRIDSTGAAWSVATRPPRSASTRSTRGRARVSTSHDGGGQRLHGHQIAAGGETADAQRLIRSAAATLSLAAALLIGSAAASADPGVPAHHPLYMPDVQNIHNSALSRHRSAAFRTRGAPGVLLPR